MTLIGLFRNISFVYTGISSLKRDKYSYPMLYVLIEFAYTPQLSKGLRLVSEEMDLQGVSRFPIWH